VPSCHVYRPGTTRCSKFEGLLKFKRVNSGPGQLSISWDARGGRRPRVFWVPPRRRRRSRGGLGGRLSGACARLRCSGRRRGGQFVWAIGLVLLVLCGGVLVLGVGGEAAPARGGGGGLPGRGDVERLHDQQAEDVAVRLRVRPQAAEPLGKPRRYHVQLCLFTNDVAQSHPRLIFGPKLVAEFVIQGLVIGLDFESYWYYLSGSTFFDFPQELFHGLRRQLAI